MNALKLSRPLEGREQHPAVEACVTGLAHDGMTIGRPTSAGGRQIL